MNVPWKKIGQGRAPIEAGVYEVEVKSWEAGTSKNNNPRIEIILITTRPEGSEGRELRDYITLTDAAIWRLGWFVSSCGIKVGELEDMESGSEEFRRVLQACVGRKLWVTVVIDSYDGKQNNKITEYAKVEDQEEIVVEDDVPSFIKNKRKNEGSL
jgi:hypothetical protein